MPKMKFRKAFRYHPKGMAGVTVKMGDIAEVSDEVAASAVKSGAAVLVDDDQPEEQPPEAAEAGQDVAGGDSEAPAASEGPGSAGLSEGNDGAKSASPVEDKSLRPAEDKATS